MPALRPTPIPRPAVSAHDELIQSAALHGKTESTLGTDVLPQGTNVSSLVATEKDTSKYTGGQTNVSSEFSHGSASMEVAQSDSAKFDVTPDTTRLDQALSDNTSALRLAQNLGADFILIPSITTYGTEKKTYNGNGISTVNVTHTLRVSCKIVEAGAGGAIKGGMAMASKTIRQSGELQVDNSDVINELLDDAADQLADTLVQSAGSLPTEVAKDKQGQFLHRLHHDRHQGTAHHRARCAGNAGQSRHENQRTRSKCSRWM